MTDIFETCNQRIVTLLNAFEQEGHHTLDEGLIMPCVQSLHLVGSRRIMIDPSNDIVRDALAHIDQQFKDLLDNLNASPRLREIVWSVVEGAKA